MSKKINANFYDIESLDNIFTLANYKPLENLVDIYVLCDTPELFDEQIAETNPNRTRYLAELAMRIHDHNKNFATGSVKVYNLHDEESVEKLAEEFGLCDAPLINDPESKSNYPPQYRLVCDTDPEYKKNPDKYPYLMGYNSYNYDTTMLALYLNLVLVTSDTGDPRYTTDLGTYRNGAFNRAKYTKYVSAKRMRDLNDTLFASYKDQMPSYLLYRENKTNRNYNDQVYLIRRNMLLSGRHIDVARLNEKQSKVGLKRLLGMLGYQILESDKLSSDQSTVETIDQLFDLIAYNVSDVVNLNQLFNHKLYQAQFELKKGLLETYPELIYKQLPGRYRPDISQKAVRSDRLYIDSSSAQFATKTLCPYGTLNDTQFVSFDYPHPEIAKITGVKTRDILEESKEFFYSLYPNRPDLQARFNVIYNFYAGIRGKNFNNSKAYIERYTEHINTKQGLVIKEPKVWSLSRDIPAVDTCLPYFDKDGNPTSCYALFSTGGIHGAEYNAELYEADLAEFKALEDDFNEVKERFGADQAGANAVREAKTIIMNDGREFPYTKFLKSGRRKNESEYRDIESQRPKLFKEAKNTSRGGGNDNKKKINPRYVFTSADQANHEDFTSYYPNLLRQMRAFWNDGFVKEGEEGDRYGVIFEQKQTYGHLMKDKSKSEEERSRARILREGTKLILNSASGAADATFENNIRMNNTIIAMRIIGQLFSWRIGQAQTYAGAKIISTNTDGLYSVMEEKKNAEILENEAKSIGVEIEPEPLFLISKDSNNRIELTEDLTVTGASGGTLACRKGPDPGKSLAHPAAIDWALTEYLVVASQRSYGLGLDKPFDEQIGMNIIKAIRKKFDEVHQMIMFQNVIASSPGSYTYIFGTTDAEPSTPIPLQHYNRTFIMKEGSPNTIHLKAAVARVVTPAMIKKRYTNKEPNVRDPIAVTILTKNGVNLEELTERDITVKKITGIDMDWSIRICNEDLFLMTTEERQAILDNLDYEKYLQMMKTSYENNWRNHLPSNGDTNFEVNDDEESED